MVDLVMALAESDCERLRSGWLAQPANAVSSLAYVVVGIGFLWRSRRDGVVRPALVIVGAAMVGVGIGSVAYHGPQPGWAAFAHDAGVFALAFAIVAQNLWMLARPATRRAVVAAWRSAAPWMAPAVAAYVAGRTGSSLCHPTSLWQFHAAWHALSAVGLGVAVRRASAGNDGARVPSRGAGVRREGDVVRVDSGAGESPRDH